MKLFTISVAKLALLHSPNFFRIKYGREEIFQEDQASERGERKDGATEGKTQSLELDEMSILFLRFSVTFSDV